ncbi:MAG: DEAD/DEAH box helicase [Elusimicrobiota bacterium]
MKFNELSIHPDLLKAVTAMGFEKPTPIQQQAIPPALEGQDIVGSAQTGSGKTVAFALPLLNRLLTKEARNKKTVRAVILVPVRELAAQVEAVLAECGQFTKLKTTLIMGGASWPQQVKALNDGIDIVVATPGRLLDHLQNNRGFHLRDCEFLILDEGDRMLDMGFLPDIQRILQQLSADRQTLVFSATIPPEIAAIVKKFQKNPTRIKIDPTHAPAEGVRQRIFPITESQKCDLLVALIEHFKIKAALVFTATKRRADIVQNILQKKGYAAAALHSDLAQNLRTKTLQAFRDKKTRILVATDIAARGFDIRHVSHVINYDVPTFNEDYLHRIGRTARVFTVGDAFTLMNPQEKGEVESIERFLKMTIERCALEGFDYDVPPNLKAYKAPYQTRFRMPKRSFKKGRSRPF